MFLRYCFAICAIAVPLAIAGYPHHQPSAYHGSSYDELVNAATGGSQHAAQAITKTAEIQPTAAEAANLGHVQAQLEALQGNPTYQNLQNSETIADTLATGNLASNIRQGRIGVVAPNQANQALYRSMLVPAGPNNHNVIATQPLPPIVVNQPGAPPQQISSGPPAVVKAAPVIYKIKPSVIYQQEVINKVPTPLSLNPVYVKVYKPGKKIDAPTAPVVQPQYHQYSAPQYHNSYPAPSSYADAPADSYAHPTQYAPQPAHYAPQPAYAPQYQPQAAY